MKEKNDYKRIVERVTNALAATPNELAHWSDITGRYINAATDMTKDELALIEAYLKRDMQSFSEHYLHQQKPEVDSEAFRRVIADTIWEKLADITDKTQLEWTEVMRDIEHHGVYHSGEVIGLGVLVCEKCGKQTAHYHVAVLTPCIQCGNNTFSRQAFPA